MNKTGATIVFSFLMVIGFGSLFLNSCREKSKEDIIILTRTAGKTENSNFFAADSQRNILRSEIVVIEPGNPDASPKLLTSSFY